MDAGKFGAERRSSEFGIPRSAEVSVVCTPSQPMTSSYSHPF